MARVDRPGRRCAWLCHLSADRRQERRHQLRLACFRNGRQAHRPGPGPPVRLRRSAPHPARCHRGPDPHRPGHPRHSSFSCAGMGGFLRGSFRCTRHRSRWQALDPVRARLPRPRTPSRGPAATTERDPPGLRVSPRSPTPPQRPTRRPGSAWNRRRIGAVPPPPFRGEGWGEGRSADQTLLVKTVGIQPVVTDPALREIEARSGHHRART
jgi:hypothetical protein